MSNDLMRAGPMVIPAKLRPPVPRDDSVARPDLVSQLEAAGPTRLRAIVAPTGWGKSELVAQWLAAHPHPTAYVRLDDKDADPSRCWAHVLTALRDACGVELDDLIEVLRAPVLPIVDEIVEPLLPRDSIEALVDGRPPTMGVALVSRSEPPLHLPRRRVRGELCEIRLDGLRMDADAARRVVHAASGVELDADSAATLVSRTEGWAAGLYLAALSMRADEDPAEFIERFSGTDRNLSEYLASEVLAGMDAEDRSFLVGTAVLDEFEPDLCDAVLGRSDSAARIDQLSRTNLFMVPVDERRAAYRYHQLFRQWLDMELRREGPAAAPEAHLRAARAYAARGDRVRAADHALDTEDADLAYDSVAASSLELLDTGRHTTLNRYCERLPPPPDADREFQLALMRGWSSIVDGDLDSVDRCCHAASAALDTGLVDDRLQGRTGEIVLLRSYSRLLRGAPAECREILAAARADGTGHRASATAEYLDSAAAYWLGSTSSETLRDTLTQARATAVAVGDPYAKLLCEAYLALHTLDALDARDAGDGAAPDEWIEATFATADDHHLVGFGYLAAGHWARGRQHIARGDLEAAHVDAERAVELAERRGDTLVASGARVTLSIAHHARGDRAAARELLDTVDRDLAPLDVPDILAERVAVARRQLRLQQQPAATRGFDDPVEELTDREIALLRLLPGDLTQRELGNALHMSFNTVKTYNRQIYRKLGVSSRDDAVAAARASGLL
jgi:LuxR family maltose regulon positive regulatory protein